ncbi:MAG: hypothetical protein LBU00_00255 [Treponema sp.]|jgi:hypothetical protein|nr:hypothetical protein [Treponema sp.]
MKRFTVVAGILLAIMVLALLAACSGGTFVDPGHESAGLLSGEGGGGTGGNGGGTGGDGGGGGSIPTELVGSWGTSGAQMLKINADGSGQWGAGLLALACSWSVSGDKLTLNMTGGTGTVTWSVSNNKLTVSHPTGIMDTVWSAAINASPLDKLN